MYRQDRQEKPTGPRTNRQIRAPLIRVISAEGEILGDMSPEAGRKHAEEAGFDLVEVSPRSQPPVCRIMDFGKYCYLQKKKAQESKTHQTPLKEIRLGFKTDPHDVEVLMRKASELLGAGHPVELVMLLRGRENAHQPLARTKLEEAVGQLSGQCDREPLRCEGRSLRIVLRSKARTR